MAFTLQNFARSTGSNGTQHTVNNATGVGTLEGAPVVYTYRSAADLTAVIVAANYFLPVLSDLNLYDMIYSVDSAGVCHILTVATILYRNDNEAANVPTVTTATLV